jgi:long-chain acyl-CoA synthetase
VTVGTRGEDVGEPWLEHYPASVPATIEAASAASVLDLLEDAFRRYAQRVAYQSFGQRLRYAAVEAHSRAFAAWLQHAGFAPGDRIAIMLPNCLQYPIALFGALRAGLTVVNVNPLYTPRELLHQLEDSGAQLILAHEGASATVSAALAQRPMKHVLVTGLGDLLAWPKSVLVNRIAHRRMGAPAPIPGALAFRTVLAEGARLPYARPSPAPEALAFLQYTGGTTGVSKAAMLTHRNIVANMLQVLAWNEPVHAALRGEPALELGALPFYHIYALMLLALVALLRGSEVLLIANPRDLDGLVRELRRRPLNIVHGVNTLYNGLLHAPGFKSIDWSKLVACGSGGAALQGAVAERWKAATGCVISQGWGLTETSPVVTSNVFAADFNGSVGLPLPSTRVAAFDDEGAQLPPGSSGELCVHGPQVMAGYWQRPDETAKVLLPGGWLRTGDIGRVDAAGFVYIEDRKKDMILVSGFNVYPNEIESVIAQHPGVREVAAVARPDALCGEAVVAVVVRNDPGLTEAALVAHCRRELTGYKVPKLILFRDELPKSPVGKILRRTLREELARETVERAPQRASGR